MSATILEIVEKVVPTELYPSVPQNFVVREGESIPAQIVVENPNVSLYCLDDGNQQALFVETPPGVDVTRVPFFYVTQYQRARRLIAVPYDSLHRLADDLHDPRLLFIHSVGRCGSTLISQALGEVDGVLSLSEPDVYTLITMMRKADSSRDEDYTRLLKSCTRILCRATPTAALKFRALCIHIGDLLYRAFPEATNLFLYRNAETWAQSMNSAFSGDATPLLDDPVFLLFLASHAPLMMPFMERNQRQPSLIENLALVWLSIVDKYLALHDQGVPFLAVRYEDIMTQPKRVLAALFDYAGLNPAGIDAAYRAFSKDSQEGTAVSRENREKNAVGRLDAAALEQVRAVLSEHARIQSPEFVAPGTLTLSPA